MFYRVPGFVSGTPFFEKKSVRLVFPKMRLLTLFVLGVYLCPLSSSQAVDSVEVHLDTLHSVGEVSEFDRSKYIVLHSGLSEHDWEGEEDKLDYLLRDLDVYFGRDNGSNVWYYNQSTEDPNRPGYVDPEYMVTEGARVRTENYGQDLAFYHQYEDKSHSMIGALPSPHWPGHMTNPCCGGTPWGPTTARGSGEYLGRFLQEFFRDPGEDPTQGRKRPRFVEVMNEPLYDLVTVGDRTPLEVFEYHNVVAEEIRKLELDVLVGGYTTAFPYFDSDNFQRWHDRYKLFMDTAAENMDFYSLHFYDFDRHGQPGGGTKGPWNFKGGRIEATFDMVEQYGHMTLGEVKPMLISEYGSRDHQLELNDWSRERDWVFIKSFSPLMMTFMDRPHLILKAIPFILVKAEWSETVYDWRLMRQKSELDGEIGDEWVFTDLVKLYELWSDVNGKRVYSSSTDVDLMTDVYVEGDKAYVIVSNIEVDPKTIKVDIKGLGGRSIQQVRAKHLHAIDGITALTETIIASEAEFQLGAESTVIFEYSFDDPVSIDELVEEKKYYADTYLQEIAANEGSLFRFSDVDKGDYGFGVFRISVGRYHDRSLNPLIRLNGTDIRTPEDFPGDDQATRANFFGMLEVAVPNYLIEESNEIEVVFGDSGGFVSSVTLEVFSSSRSLKGNQGGFSFAAVGNDGYVLDVSVADGEPNAVFTVLESNRLQDPTEAWAKTGAALAFDEVGKARFTRTLQEGEQFYTLAVCPECLPPAGPAESVTLSRTSVSLAVGTQVSLDTEVLPVNALDKSVVWSTTNAAVATVNEGGLVTAIAAGNCEIEALNELSGIAATCQIEVIEGLATSGVVFDEDSKYLNNDYIVGGSLEVVCHFNAGTGNTVTAGREGITVLLRELNSDWNVVKDVKAADSSAVGLSKGIARVSISLEGLTPANELPTGNFYYLFAIFEASDGNSFNVGIRPLSIVAE